MFFIRGILVNEYLPKAVYLGITEAEVQHIWKKLVYW